MKARILMGPRSAHPWSLVPQDNIRDSNSRRTAEAKKHRNHRSVMNPQQGQPNQREYLIAGRAARLAGHAFAVGILMAMVACVSIPMAWAGGVPEQLAGLQQQITAVQATVN